MRTRQNLIRRLRDQQGIALVMALGILLVLGIASVAMLRYTSSGSRHASYSASNTNAFSLAEAGVNAAMSVLSNPVNDPTTSSLLPSSGSPRTDNYQTGSVSWYGSYNSGTRVWTITSTGSASNPTGGASETRKITQAGNVVATSTTPPSSAWNYVYSSATGSPCDLTLDNSTTSWAPLYVAGNLCMYNGSGVSGGAVHVQGQVTMNQSNNSIGSSGSPINEAHVKNGCKYLANPVHNPCTNADKVFATVIDSNPVLIPPPVADFSSTGWYQKAAIGPTHPCTTQAGTPPTFDNNAVLDNSVSPTQNLTPNSSYTCQTWNGTLSWNNATKTLTVDGTIYIDGSAQISSSLASYNGYGTLYLSGTFSLGNSNKLCALVSGSDCNWSGWDPNNEMFAIIANGGSPNGISVAQSAEFQGGFYATNNIDLGNQAHVDGPMIARTITWGNQAQSDPFPTPITKAPWGLPGNTVAYADVKQGQFNG